MKISIVDKDGNPADVSYATKHSAGFDIKADLSGMPAPKIVRMRLNGPSVKVPTGLFIKVEGEVENGMVPALLITPRSGKSLEGFNISNSPGLIDADFKGEIMVIIDRPRAGVGCPGNIKDGDKIAQGVFIMVPRFDVPVEDVERGEGGFGSTDAKKIVTPPIKKK